jgi:hypothetical protein
MDTKGFGFVEIDEKDTPYYKFQFSNNWDSSKTVSDPLPQICTNQTEKRKSKNSIFEMDHKISKPITQMTTEELEIFKRDLRSEKPTIAEMTIKTESLSVPVSFPVFVKQPSLTTIEIPAPKPLAFLSMNPCTTVHKQHVSTDSNSSIYLSYLPIKKNFLGEGQYSHVYKGTYTKDTKEYPCAVKVIHKNYEAQRLAMSESFILSQLSHPSIISLIHTRDELGLDSIELEKLIQEAFHQEVHVDVGIVLVLEYCSNGNMWNWMQKHSNSINKKLWLKWARELASGIELVHSMGIIHHDIKPHNILVFLVD